MSDYETNRLRAGSEFTQGALESQKSFTEDDIRKDNAFGEAYKIVHKYLNNEDIEDSNENLANYGMQFISDVKNPLLTADEGLGLIGAYAKFKDAPKNVKDSMWYMWDKYEEADMTWNAFGRALKSIGKDPSTYTGVAAGLKLFGTKAASSIAMNRFKNMLLSGVASGAYTGGEEFVKQEIQGLEQKDWDSINQMASIGAVIGVVAPPAIEGAVKGVKTIGKGIEKTIQEGEELMMQQAGGGTPPFTYTMFTDLKVDEFGNRKLKQKVHLKDGSRLSGMTDNNTFYGYTKNGEQFTMKVNDVKRSDIIQDTKQGKQLFDFLDKTNPLTVEEEILKESN